MIHRQRRTFLRNLAWLAAGTAFPLQPALAAESATRQASIEAWAGRIRGMLERGVVPFLDTQATYVGTAQRNASATNIPLIMEFMDKVGVAQICFAPAFTPNSNASLELHRRYPAYFIPTTCSAEYPRWWNNPMAFLEGVAEDLKSGEYYMMGEHEFRHYPSPEQVGGPVDRDITVDITGPAGHALFSLSERTGISFELHYEIEDRLLPGLETMLAAYPKARPIWCHLGMIRYPDRTRRYGPAYVDELIRRFPNLHFDLAVPPPENVYKLSGARDSTLFDGNQMAAGWKALIEKHPQRFLCASDYRPPVEQNYMRYMTMQRKLILVAFDPQVQHLLAFGNAWRLITGKDWTG